jgi:hypothetical protein
MAITKKKLQRIPVLGSLATLIFRRITGRHKSAEPFPGSEKYWEQRYASGGDSGAGSYSKFAKFKAKFLNAFVAEHDIKSVIEFGCGDGSQLELAVYPEYLGLDVSDTVIAACRKKFSSDPRKTFKQVREFSTQTAELTLSLDVIYHLLEDHVYEEYMRSLFNAATRYAVIYSSNTDNNEGFEGTHVKHRTFGKWVAANIHGWKLQAHIPNEYPYKGDYTTGSFADFYVYKRIEQA